MQRVSLYGIHTFTVENYRWCQTSYSVLIPNITDLIGLVRSRICPVVPWAPARPLE